MMKLPKLNLFLLLLLTSNVQPQITYLTRMEEKFEEMMSMLKAENIYRYDCSTKSITEWEEIGQSNLMLGLYYIITGVLFMALGTCIVLILSIKIINQQMQGPYKIMALMGILGVIELTGNSVWPGYSVLNGTVYCTHQGMTTFFGKLTMVTWLAGSALAVFLGLHRLLDLTKKGIVLVNSDWKTNIWFCCIIIYALYGSIFFDTVLYNSIQRAPWLNPMIGLSEDHYSNCFLYYHNIVCSTLLITIYLVIGLYSIYNEKQASFKYITATQKHIIVQSVIIASTYAIPAVMFVLMYWIPNIPKWFILAADIAYQLSAGIPFIMYIGLNRQVRDAFLNSPRACISWSKRHNPTVSTNTHTSTFLVT
ncbi:unnamed protein product [Caenorhabditis brenneri]